MSSSNPATPSCRTITNIFAHQYIRYCDSEGVENVSSYTNPVSRGSLASPPPTSTSSNSSSSKTSKSTSASSSSTSTSVTLPSNITYHADQNSSSLSPGAIAGITVGSLVVGFGALALCFIFLILPLLRKRKRRDDHHPRGTLGGAIIPSSWMGHGGNAEDARKQQEQKDCLGSASAGTTPGAGARDHSGPHTPNALTKEKPMPWDPSSYSRMHGGSEMDDTSFTPHSPELDSRPISEPSSASAYRASQLGFPYRSPGSRNPREAPDMLDYGGLPTALRTQGYPSGGTLSSTSFEAGPVHSPLSQETPSHTHQRASSQSGTTSLDQHQHPQRPESGFVSPLTSPPTSTTFEPTPPSLQGPFAATEAQRQNEPHGLGLGLTQTHTPRDQSTSRPVSSTTQPSFTISPPQDEQEQGGNSHLPPSLQAPTARTPSPGQPSNRFLYENAALTSHPVTPSPTFASAAGPSRPAAAAAPNPSQGGAEGWPFPSTPSQREENATQETDAGTGRPSEQNDTGATEGGGTTGANSALTTARGPWEGYVTAESAMRDGIWEEGSRREGSPRRG